MIYDASNLSPVAIDIFGLSIKWYGIAYAVGFICALYFLKYKAKKENDNKITPIFWDEFLTYALLGIILGGRLGYILFYNLSHYISNPLEIFAVWKGGMSFHGGGAGLLIATYIYSLKKRVNFFTITDFLMLVAPIGLLLGRLANFVNQELYGKFTDGSWGVIFHNEGSPRYPTQLFEAFLEGLVLFFVMNILYNQTNIKKYKGMLTGIFFILYALFRGSIEFLRLPTDDLGYFFGTNWITMGMILCLPMILIGIGLIIYSIKQHKKIL